MRLENFGNWKLTFESLLSWIVTWRNLRVPSTTIPGSQPALFRIAPLPCGRLTVIIAILESVIVVRVGPSYNTGQGQKARDVDVFQFTPKMLKCWRVRKHSSFCGCKVQVFWVIQQGQENHWPAKKGLRHYARIVSQFQICYHSMSVDLIRRDCDHRR